MVYKFPSMDLYCALFSSTTIFSIDLQLSNALLPIVVTPLGMKTVSKTLQPLNAKSPIVVRAEFAPNVTAAFVEEGGFDVCGFGRQIFANPDFAKNILQGGALPKDTLCLCCSKCTELMRAGSTPGCVVRDPLYAELYREHKKTT